MPGAGDSNAILARRPFSLVRAVTLVLREAQVVVRGEVEAGGFRAGCLERPAVIGAIAVDQVHVCAWYAADGPVIFYSDTVTDDYYAEGNFLHLLQRN